LLFRPQKQDEKEKLKGKTDWRNASEPFS
jgi:hypothetical protein